MPERGLLRMASAMPASLRCRGVTPDSAPGGIVPGLFAVGGCASNIAQDGAGYSSGTCIGESTFFGRRAGVKAAS